MRRSLVPAFDLLPAAHARRQAWSRRRYRNLAVPLGLGLAASLLVLAQVQSHLQSMRDVQAVAQAELDRLKARQRELAAQLQAQQAQQALGQAHRQQGERWLVASDALRAVAHPLGPPARARLLELRLDDQGLLLIGLIGPAQLQPWLDSLKSRTPALGTAWLMEIGQPSPTVLREEEPDELSRFVVRFAQTPSQATGVGP
jgi:hypothetical protein